MGANINTNHTEKLNIRSNKSEATIYENAVPKRSSSSSEEGMEYSDESLNNDAVLFVDSGNKPDGQPQQWEVPQIMHQERPMTTEEKAEKLIKAAELAKARMFSPKGERLCQINFSQLDKTNNQVGIPFDLVARFDQEYLVIGGHVDESMQQKIAQGEYVDFSKLIPRDKILTEEDNRLELVIRNGKTFWTPVSESVTINCFSRWEQAFRIYSNIYTRAHPHKSSELIQYNHVIHSISLSYIWENVYSYDKEFRLHLSKHPERCWSVILQQAWSMKLRDRLPRNNAEITYNHPKGNHFNLGGNAGGSSGSQSQHGNKFKSTEPCKLFNRGVHCKFGASCKFEYKCLYCGKFGHAVINCRKLQADKEKNGKPGNGSFKKESRDGINQ